MTPSIHQLSKHQFHILKLLANGKTKTYCAPAGTPADKRQNEINEDFNDILKLVEWGLVSDVSETPKYHDLIAGYAHEEGRDVVVIVINKGGDKMFKRVSHGRWVN
jgi:hypothetical protein